MSGFGKGAPVPERERLQRCTFKDVEMSLLLLGIGGAHTATSSDRCRVPTHKLGHLVVP